MLVKKSSRIILSNLDALITLGSHLFPDAVHVIIRKHKRVTALRRTVHKSEHPTLRKVYV